MFRLIKNIFKKTAHPMHLVIRFEEIPAWLGQRELAATEKLQKDTAALAAEIRLAAADLEKIVQALRTADFSEGIHPKLKSIAKNSLPQYTKAMEAALSRPLPEHDAAAFYAAATEMLKGCINSGRGQGKYLRTVFPEEMKTIKSGIDAIGHGTNAMTGPISAYHNETARIANAKKAYAALTDVSEDIAKSKEKDARTGRRIADLNMKIETCTKGLLDIESAAEQRALADQKRVLQTLTEERERCVRRYAVLSMTASHVLRKAEKVARRQQGSPDARVLARAMEILSDHAVPDSGNLVQALTAACPVAVRMIESGEVALKNREERELFSAPGKFIGEIEMLCAAYLDYAVRCDKAEKAIRSHPLVIRSGQLNREQLELNEMLAKEEQGRSDLIRWQGELRDHIPVLQEQLKKILGEISGNDVQIQYPGIFSSAQ
jgi:hypothetical protein